MPGEANISTARAFVELAAGQPAAPRGRIQARWPCLPVTLAILGWEAGLGLLAIAGDGTGAGLLFVFLVLAFWLRQGLYGAPPGPVPSRQLATAARGVARAFVIGLLAMLLLRHAGTAEAAETSGVMVLAGVAMLAGRGVATLALHGALHARLAPRAVLVGAGPHAAAVLAALRADRGCPRLVGIMDERAGWPVPAVPGLPYLGPVGRLEELVRTGRVQQVILAGPWAAEQRMLGLVRRIGALPVEILVAPELLARHFAGAPVTRLGGLDLVHALDRPTANWSGVAKRAEDVILGTALLLVFALPMVLVALAVRLDSPGPVLFRQRRIGFDNRDFALLKFRTMHHGPAPSAGCVQATRGDPRITRLGAFLRRSSLDELPQLFNVLRGEMSLVGPRPHAPGTSAGGRPFEDVVPCYAGRHRVKPGITGLAQVRGLRGETRTEAALRARVEADFEYIQHWSPGLDLLILLRTAWCVLSMRNAY